MHCDKGLRLDLSAFESFYGGQFTSSTQMIPNLCPSIPIDQL